MTGLIYVVIIALWAAVLIPVWLRRHDQISEVRSTARFSSAMKSLGSQGQPQLAMDPYAMEMSLPSTRSPVPEARMTHSSTGGRPVGLDPDYERELVRQSAATRRAVVLGALTLVLLRRPGAGDPCHRARAGRRSSRPSRWSSFVLAASMTASSRTAVRRERAPVGVERHASAPAAKAEAPAQKSAADEEWENWNAWDDDESWEAVPTTLPTYVTAPRASAVPRGIDRSRPGEWTGSAMVETAQAMRTRDRADALLRPPVDVDHGADTAEIPAVTGPDAPRRAVNE